MEQKIQLSKNDKVFCTGAFLQATEVEIYGKKQWHWVLVGSEDDAYLDGKRINICDYADNIQGLLMDED